MAVKASYKVISMAVKASYRVISMAYAMGFINST